MTATGPLPPPKPTLYPRRCFPAPQRRPLRELNDHLLARIMAAAAPAIAEPKTRRRARPQPDTPPPAFDTPKLSLRAATRKWNDVLGIWRQCEQPCCRSKHRCRGDSLACLPRYMPLLPPPVQFWFACVGIALEKNLPFADAVAFAGREGEQAACARWHAAIKRALPASAVPGSAPDEAMNDL